MSDNSLLAYFEQHVKDIVDLTMEFVNYETPSNDKEHVDILSRCIEQYLHELKADVERIL